MALRSPPQQVAKLDAGKRQLVAAIRLFFSNGDAVAVHTLACAAREIFERMLKARGKQRYIDLILEREPNLKEGEVARELNTFRNFFKHAHDGVDTTISFSDEANDLVLAIACRDLGELEKALPVEAQVLEVWSWAVRPGPEYLAAVKELLPNLHLLPRHEQKAKGRDLLIWACAEPALLMNARPLDPVDSQAPRT